MLIRPIPFPNEMARGYLGRVMRINGTTNEKEIDALMRAWAGVSDKNWREVCCLELLSMVAGMEMPEFTLQHTTLPLRRGITSYQPELRHGCESNREMLWSSSMRQARPGAYFCEECVLADQKSQGQSSWHREDQVPGLLWCRTHFKPLNYADDSLAFLHSPADYLDRCNVVPEDWAQEAMDNEVIQRYLDICFALLARSYPLDVRTTSTVLRAQAVRCGFQTNPRNIKFPLLSDTVVGRCGRSWLATVMPTLADKSEGVCSTKLDGVLYMKTSASSVIGYALACAMLFDSAIDAINALEDGSTAPPPEIRPKNDVIQRDQLLSVYVKVRGNYAEATKLLPGTYQAVITQLRSLGLPNLIETDKCNSLSAAMAFFVEKKSLAQCAQLGGITPGEMESILQASGGEFTQALREMQMPRGRGTGIRRPRQLTPAEALAVSGAVAFKYSPHLRPEQRHAV